MKYNLGLDLGITSIGWAVMRLDEEQNIKRIEDVGVRIFDGLEKGTQGKLENADRRMKRGQRRLRRRKLQRLDKTKKLLFSTFQFDFDKVYQEESAQGKNRNWPNPYEAKIKGLQEKLSVKELAIVLVHYCKHRGFKSNRKIVDDQAKASSDEGKLLNGIKSVEKILIEKNLTVTQYLMKEAQTNDFIMRNNEDAYRNIFNRAMYEKEIITLLDKQIELEGINEEFKNEFLAIWSRQRDFSEGPDYHSPYAPKKGGSLIEMMMGKCKFDQEMKAPKSAFSAESFVFLSSLVNLRYKEDGETYHGFNSEQIQKVYQKALSKQKITYKDILTTLGLTNARIQGLEISKKKYGNLMKKFKEDYKIGFKDNLTSEQYTEFHALVQKETLETEFRSLKNFHAQKKILESNCGKNHPFLTSFEQFDKISLILTLYKTDDTIRKACKEANFDDETTTAVLKMEGCTKGINLSLNLCKQLNPLLLQGNTYDQSMAILYKDHSKPKKEIGKVTELPKIKTILEDLELTITNHNVIHSLSETRKVVNEIIRIYGVPQQINVELARDLAQNFRDRMETQRDQLDNAYENSKSKIDLMRKFPHYFKRLSEVKRDDLIKYRLFKEQNGICPYSQELINETELFGPNYEIDHILPYSRTFDDSFNNKALVLNRMNQEKGNQTPFEAFKGEKWQKFQAYLFSNLNRISYKKKDIYCTKELDKDFLDRNLNDTRYLSKVVKEVLENYLTSLVKCTKGAITSFLKSQWGLSNLTHSLMNEKMEFQPNYCFNEKQGYFKVINEKNSITLEVFLVAEDGTTTSFKVATEKARSNFELSNEQKTKNELLSFVDKNEALIKDFIGDFSTNVNKLYDEAYSRISYRKDINNELFYSEEINYFGLVLAEIQKIKIKKNRNNHLHHAADAVVIACSTKSLIDRVTSYSKLASKERRKGLSAGPTNPKGFPLPYEELREDVKNRIYQRNFELLKKRVGELTCCQDCDERYFENLTVIYPSQPQFTKQTGALHKETFFGESKDYQNRPVITKRVNVRDLDKKNIVNLLDGPDSPLYHSIIAWWESTTEEERKTTYPKLLKKNSLIKKVKFVESEDLNSRIKLKEKRYAASDDVYRVDIYQKENDDRLFFVPINAYVLSKEEKLKTIIQNRESWTPSQYQELLEKNTFNLTVFWGRDNNYEIINNRLLNLKYKKIMTVLKNTLIEVEKKEGQKGICYSGGFTGGKFEVYSILGDDFDLLFDYSLINSFQLQYQLTVSTIKSITPLYISLLGKIKRIKVKNGV